MNVSPIKQPGALLPLVMFWVALAGAVGAVGLMLRAGHRNNSLVRMALFAVWVSSPFVALTWFNRISQRWPGLYTNDALWRDADTCGGGGVGDLREYGFGTSGFEACFPVPDGFRWGHGCLS